MKKLIAVTVFSLLCQLTALANDDEITLFDRDGQPVAYIATDDHMNIYLWKGEPAAYLKKEGRDTHIYGFSGEHLGWFEKGIVRDDDGYAVGFIEGAVSKLTKLEPLKGLRKLTPLRNLEKLAPIKPVFKDRFSSTPLKAFLLLGSKDY
jgi:hypothetical protein